MNNQNLFLTNEMNVGVPPKAFRDIKSMTFHFHNFTSLTKTKWSSPFMLFNHIWYVVMKPSATRPSDNKKWVITGLQKASAGNIQVNFGFSVKNIKGESMIVQNSGARNFEGPNTYVGLYAMTRSNVLSKESELLNNNTFTVELRISPVNPDKCNGMIPVNPFCNLISSLLFDENSADVCFAVKSRFDGIDLIEKVYAHRVVLKAVAPQLAVLCEGYNLSTPVPVNDVKPQVFRELMSYAYGRCMIKTDWGKHSKALINAANKYDMPELKVTAETWYVNYLVLTPDNVTAELLYADANTCPLLKEVAIAYILKHDNEVYLSASFKAALKAQDITHELLVATAKEKQPKSSEVGDYESMPVNDLRLSLDALNLSVDGSRDMLVGRLDE